MAIQKQKLGQPKPKPPAKVAPWPFGRKNYILFGVALIVIIIGFVLLGQNSITLAPLLLVVGYCVLIPYAIMAKDKPKSDTEPVSEQSPPKVL